MPARRPLPEDPSLENLKKQAKGLLKSVRGGDGGGSGAGEGAPSAGRGRTSGVHVERSSARDRAVVRFRELVPFEAAPRSGGPVPLGSAARAGFRRARPAARRHLRAAGVPGLRRLASLECGQGAGPAGRASRAGARQRVRGGGDRRRGGRTGPPRPRPFAREPEGWASRVATSSPRVLLAARQPRSRALHPRSRAPLDHARRRSQRRLPVARARSAVHRDHRRVRGRGGRQQPGAASALRRARAPAPGGGRRPE